MNFDDYKRKTDERFEIAYAKLEYCKRRLEKNDTTFDWNNIQFNGEEFGIDAIKNRLNNELNLSDMTILNILQIMFEEWKKLEELEA